ncbi:MAG TPA: platelet-activating factor acetylhydrolase IB subunit [Pirellulales bacterium]|nr:platelet-activating factor acetylhydrolase IB subunit [Pirellulales bacterium]
MIRRRLWLTTLALWTVLPLVARADEPATVKPVPRDEKWWTDRNDQFNARAKQGDVDVIFLGDSITHGWEGKEAQPIWDKYFAPRKAMNAGIGGDRTQHVLWRLDHGNIDGIKPKLAVIMIGTNNSGSDSSEDIAAGIKAIVEKLRKALPETKILILGIFPRGPNADDAKRKTNIGANEIVKKLDDGKQVHYLDISDKFLEPDGTLSKEIMPDLLHLSQRGYQIWAEAIDGKLAELGAVARAKE